MIANDVSKQHLIYCGKKTKSVRAHERQWRWAKSRSQLPIIDMKRAGCWEGFALGGQQDTTEHKAWRRTDGQDTTRWKEVGRDRKRWLSVRGGCGFRRMGQLEPCPHQGRTDEAWTGLFAPGLCIRVLSGPCAEDEADVSARRTSVHPWDGIACYFCICACEEAIFANAVPNSAI